MKPLRCSGRLKILFISLLCLGLLAGCSQQTVPPEASSGVEQSQTEKSAGQATGPNGQVQAGTMRLTIYHASKDAEHLVPEVHTVPQSTHPAQTALELLLAGTKNKELTAVIPAGTKLRSITVKDHIAYPDFTDKLIKDNRGGSASEILIVGAIVDTLTEFPEIQKVRILVEGKPIDTISGHLDLSQPLGRSEDIIKR